MRAFSRVLALLVTGLLAAGVLAAGPAAAQSDEDDPPFIPWSTILPTLTTGYDPTSSNVCVAGKIRCIDAVIQEMQRRLKPLAKACDHDAVFELTYLRTTEEFKRASTTPGFFSDAPFLNHQAAVFATYYFEAYDDWKAGRRSQVPQAWRIALQAADGQDVSAGGNLLLGLAAHVNRDLPYVLDAIGLVKPDGSSRKPDHDKVNVFLNRVTEPLIAEIGRRFDPSINSTDVPGTQLDATTLFQLIQSWRELAWRNAELLANARTAAERSTVATTIETTAATIQTTLKAESAYLKPLQTPAARNAWCAAHWNDP